MFAHNARIDDKDENTGIPSIFGDYDLTKITRALAIIGQPNPLKPEWRAARSLVFDAGGKLEGQGLWLAGEFALLPNVAFGARTAIMHAQSSQRFTISDSIQNELKLGDGGDILFDEQRRQAQRLLGLTGNQWNAWGATDLDIYARYGYFDEYILKCRSFDAGLSLGALVPTGRALEIDNPASVPFSGNKHWGLYAMADVTAQMRDDWYLGGWLQLLYRFPKTQTLRMPTEEGEMLPFAAIVGPVNVKPGFTVGFSPYFILNDLREGLGVQFQYTVVAHMKDRWFDARSDKTIKSNVQIAENHSDWLAEYFTIGILYAVSQAVPCKKVEPLAYMTWDIPVGFVGAFGVAKTNRFSVGVQLYF